jgi:hypothetical protein
MPPLSTHRRARRRSRAGRLVLLGCAAVVLALVIGGVTQVGRQSDPFYTSVNRSFATQAAAVVQQSNATGASLRHLLATMQNQDRRTLQANLDTLTTQADQESAAADALNSSASPGDVQGQFATVISQRAQAVRNFRSAIDGLLGMHPLPIAGARNFSATATATATATPALLPTAQVTGRIAAAGKALVTADSDYRSLRRSLVHMAGHARLPSSRWVTVAEANAWQPGPVATQVQVVQASHSLQATHRLVLRVVKATPPALPPANGVATPALSVLSPTTKVVLQVVISDLGSVDEPHASVQFTLTPQPSGAAVTVTRSAPVAAAGSVSLAPASFKVKPGMSYQLTVAIVLPAGQTDASGSSLSETLQIAPGT